MPSPNELDSIHAFKDQGCDIVDPSSLVVSFPFAPDGVRLDLANQEFPPAGSFNIVMTCGGVCVKADSLDLDNLIEEVLVRLRPPLDAV